MTIAIAALAAAAGSLLASILLSWRTRRALRKLRRP